MKSSKHKLLIKPKNSRLFAQHTHRIFQPFEGEREHAVANQLLDDADALAVLPHTQWLGVDPSELRVGVCESLNPLRTGFFVVALYRLLDYLLKINLTNLKNSYKGDN